MKRLLTCIFAAGCLLLLAGCDISITNLTPVSLPSNPSNIYTITSRATPKTTAVLRSSIEVSIVIDGQTHPMKKSSIGGDIYEFDYQLPAGRDEIAYYYLVGYKVDNNGHIVYREEYSQLMKGKIVGRYVFALEANRGPVGSRISVVGRGFTNGDVISLDGKPVQTEFESANALAFYVPAVETGKNYAVTVSGPAGTSPVGTFRVDSSEIKVSPSSVTVSKGHTVELTFSLSGPAAPGGQLLDVTTDIPDSIIMPEVVVPAGQSSVTVTIKGGKPGSGSLFLRGYGEGEITVPVTVQ